jgi:hypothetical protein
MYGPSEFGSVTAGTEPRSRRRRWSMYGVCKTVSGRVERERWLEQVARRLPGRTDPMKKLRARESWPRVDPLVVVLWCVAIGIGVMILVRLLP